jgi:hypothetical protein
MDPFLESPTHWADFHARFIPALADAINDLLPEQYVARINEHVMSIAPTYRAEGEDDPEFIPDVAVIAPKEPAISKANNPLSETPQTGAVAAPVIVANVNFLDEYSEGYIEIVRLPQPELVTVIELLSPTNKYGEGRGLYMKKRREFLAQPVNLVELDLLRAGARLQFDQPLPAGHYHVFVSKMDQRPKTAVYSWSVREPILRIPIPLKPGEFEIIVDLSLPLRAAYEAGRYRKLIDYRASPPPPSFSSVDAEWIRQLLTTQ